MIGPLTCREVVARLTEHLERAISWNQRIRTLVHLRLCPECHELLADVKALPLIVERCGSPDAASYASIGEAALVHALGHLHDRRPARRLPPTPVPAAVQRVLAAQADLPLRLMTRTHAAILDGTAPRTEPFLPEDVLAELPPTRDWRWRHSPRGMRRAALWSPPGGPSLSLVHMPPRFTLAAHTHQGSESLLVLVGELEHGDRCLTDGDWVHMEAGTSHSPYAFGEGCWCLVRDEGAIRYHGPFGWFKGLMPS